MCISIGGWGGGGIIIISISSGGVRFPFFFTYQTLYTSTSFIQGSTSSTSLFIHHLHYLIGQVRGWSGYLIFISLPAAIYFTRRYTGTILVHLNIFMGNTYKHIYTVYGGGFCCGPGAIRGPAFVHRAGGRRKILLDVDINYDELF